MNCFKLPQKTSKISFVMLLIAGTLDMSCVRPRSLQDGSVVAASDNPAMDEYWIAINQLVGKNRGKSVKAKVGDVEVEMNLSTDNFWGLNLSNLKDDNASVAIYFKSDRRKSGPDISFNWFNEEFSQFGFFGDNDPQQANVTAMVFENNDAPWGRTLPYLRSRPHSERRSRHKDQPRI